MFKKLASLVILMTFTFGILSISSATYAKDPKKPASSSGTQKEEEKLANSPAKCGSIDKDPTGRTPRNCLFLEEPIGGKPGYDLYLVECVDKRVPECTTKLWNGGSVPSNARGPIQAILTEDPSKPYQGPFGLLYGYLKLFYNYMSGLIVGLAVLFTVVGGIQMITSAGGEGFESGKKRITKSLIGLVLWFLSSLILYTINPTFFSF